MANHEVIIIGAGIAGLTCAKYLNDYGIEPLVLEASDTVGGRVRTDEVEGFLLDRGFQILLTSYPEAQKLLDYKALDLKNFRSGALIRLNNGFSTMSNPFKEPLLLFQALLSPVGTFGDKLKILQLSNEVAKESTQAFFNDKDTDTLSYLQRCGWSETMITNFFKPFFGGVFLENELATSSNFFRFLFKHFYGGDAAIPANGMHEIRSRSRPNCRSEVSKTGSKVEKINDRTVTLTNGQTLHAKHLVIATDASQADRLLQRTVTREFNVTTCTYFAADRSPSTDKMLLLNPNRLSSVHHLCVPSDISPAYAPAGKALISVSTQGLEFVDETKLTEHILQELTEWYGDEVKSWRHLRTYHLPEALVKYKAHTAAPSLKTAENLYECGDHMAYPSLNAAMATGRAVADMIAGI
ncbi:MAG: NAD(P)/FAD-dependent oxidoreductase [Spirosomataceae bacterium]